MSAQHKLRADKNNGCHRLLFIDANVVSLLDAHTQNSTLCLALNLNLKLKQQKEREKEREKCCRFDLCLWNQVERPSEVNKVSQAK